MNKKLKRQLGEENQKINRAHSIASGLAAQKHDRERRAAKAKEAEREAQRDQAKKAISKMPHND